MAASFVLFGLYVVISLHNVLTFEIPRSSKLPLPTELLEKCYAECDTKFGNISELLLASDGIHTEVEVCYRGCRFLAIADALVQGAHLDVSVDENACSSCCNDSYEDSFLMTCNSGCNIMERILLEAKSSSEEQPIVLTSSFSIAIYVEEGTSEEQTAGQASLRSQAEGIISSTLPQLNALPAETETVSIVQSSSCWSWLNNAVEMRNLPPCLIAAALILLVVMLIRFLFACDFRTRNHVIAGPHFDDDVTDTLTKSAYMPGKSAPVTVVIDADVSAIHKIPPPKYEEAILQPGDIIIKKSPVV